MSGGNEKRKREGLMKEKRRTTGELKEGDRRTSVKERGTSLEQQTNKKRMGWEWREYL